MGALRKAGGWLGLVPEDDVEHGEGIFDDEFGDEDDEYAPPARPRSLTRQRVFRSPRFFCLISFEFVALSYLHLRPRRDADRSCSSFDEQPRDLPAHWRK